MSLCYNCFEVTSNYIEIAKKNITDCIDSIFIFFEIDNYKHTEELKEVIVKDDSNNTIYATTQPEKIDEIEILWDILSVEEF